MRFHAKACISLIFLAVAGSLALLAATTPRFDKVMETALGSDQILLGAHGEVIQTLRTDFSKRRLAWHPLSAFADVMPKAVVAAEDQRFYSHPGVDPIGLGRAAWAILRRHPIQGASTITMQVADLIQDDVLQKNRRIRKGSALHKLWQIGRALGLELRWSKAEILEAYLNLIHLRGEFQGVPAVSYAYLHKDPLALDEGEALAIAAMISSPNQGLAALKTRACGLARRRDPARDCSRVHAAAEAFFRGTPAMPNRFGSAPHLARRLFQNHRGSPVIRSTLDGRLQEAVSAILEKNIQRLAGENVRDSAAIVIENRTGRVLAYVGAVSTSESPHVDGVQAYRQAGSSLKPFLYGKAIDLKRLTVASILLDDPTAISWGGEVYRPSNYDKHFYGPVSVREALGSSLNVPAVKTAIVLGLHQAYDVLQSIHLTNLREPDFYGASLALGAVEVRLEDLANAYRIYANGGSYTPLLFTADEKAPAPERVYGAPASFVLASILSDPNARSIGFGWESPLETPFWAAVKTGTSKDYRDNWCVGFSELYTVAVWAGNYDASAMKKVSGVSGAGPSWYDIMVHLHERIPSHAPAMPAGVVAKKIRHSWESGETLEYFLAGTEPAGAVVEPALTQRPEFVFPAESSVLVKDPHIDPALVALYVRFKGNVPPGAELTLDGRVLGPAVSPFKVAELPVGPHELAIRAPGGSTAAHVRFLVKGAR